MVALATCSGSAPTGVRSTLAINAATAATPSPSPSAAPSSTAPPGPSAAGPAVVSCRPDAASLSAVFPSPLPAPLPIPPELPAGLPGGLVPAGASVYGVGVPAKAHAGAPAWTFYAVGPTGSACHVGLGDFTDVELAGPLGSDRVYLDFPGSEGPSLLLACRYVAAAREAAAPFASPGDCAPSPTDRATALATASPQDHVVLVSSAPAPGADATLAVYEFAEGSGQSAKAECRLPAGERPTCLAALAFFVSQVDVVSTPPERLTSQLESLLR